MEVCCKRRMQRCVLGYIVFTLLIPEPFHKIIQFWKWFSFLNLLIQDIFLRRREVWINPGNGSCEINLRAITGYFDRAALPGATITLVAMPGRESFYERFGFVRCPNGPFGDGMHYTRAPAPEPMDSSTVEAR